MGHRGTLMPGVSTVYTEKKKKSTNSEQVFVPHRIISAVKTVQFGIGFFHVRL